MSKVPCGGFKLDENFLGMNENDELSLVGGGGEGKAYQQLVTDGDGKATWEDRLAYVDTEEQVIFSQEDIAFTEQHGLYFSPYIGAAGYDAGMSCKVVFDGETYNSVSSQLGESILIGNKSLLNMGDNTGEPFLIVYSTEDQTIQIATVLASSTHTVSIYAEVEVPKKIDEKLLPEVTKLVMLSSTPDSTKKFEITVDDTGTLSATEITSEDVPQPK